jgi:hypothetical protein
MPDYGRELEFGAFIPPVAEQADDVLELARLADVVGLDLGHLPGSPVPAELPRHVDAAGGGRGADGQRPGGAERRESAAATAGGAGRS